MFPSSTRGPIVFLHLSCGFSAAHAVRSTPLQITIPNVGLAVDGSGNVYVGGNTGTGLPIPSGSQAFQSALNGRECRDYQTQQRGNCDPSGHISRWKQDRLHMGPCCRFVRRRLRFRCNDVATISPKKSAAECARHWRLQRLCDGTEPDLSALVYSTYFGANSQVNIYNLDVSRFATNSLAIDSSGNAYILGQGGAGFPTTPEHTNRPVSMASATL